MNSVTVGVELKDEFLNNIMITAFDSTYGACWRWAAPFNSVPDVSDWLTTVANPNDPDDSLWAEANIFDYEEWEEDKASSEGRAERPKKLVVNFEKLTEAIDAILGERVRYMQHESLIYQNVYKAVLAQTESYLDADLDAIDCDAIVQVVVFGCYQYA